MKKILFLLVFVAVDASAVVISSKTYNYIWNPYTNTQQYVTSIDSTSIQAGSNVTVTTNASGVIISATSGGGGGTTIWGQDDEQVISNSVSTVTVNGVLKSTLTASGKMAIFLNYDTNQFLNVASTFAANPATFTMLGPDLSSTYLTNSSVTVNYLSQSSANVTYFPLISSTTLLTTSSATANYLKLSSASVTYRYASKIVVSSVTSGASMSITGTNNIVDAAPIFNVDCASVTCQGTAVSSLSAVNFSPGSFTNTSLTVDAQGRVTAASSGVGGSGAAFSLAITTGSFGAYTGPVMSTSSTRTLIVFDTNTFNGSVTGGTTFFTTLNTSSVTLSGPITILVSSDTAGPSMLITGSNNVLKAAPIFNVNPSSVTCQGPIVSSITARTITQGQLANSDWGDLSLSAGVATVDNVAAANVAAGSLGTSVIISSISAKIPAYMINGGVAFSSVPVMHAGGYLPVLASGVTFYSFTPDSAITLIRVSATITIAGTGGAGDNWKIGSNDTSTNRLTVQTAAAAAAGVNATAVGSIAIAAGTKVNAWIDTTANPRPAGNLVVEYKLQ